MNLSFRERVMILHATLDELAQTYEETIIENATVSYRKLKLENANLRETVFTLEQRLRDANSPISMELVRAESAGWQRCFEEYSNILDEYKDTILELETELTQLKGKKEEPLEDGTI